MNRRTFFAALAVLPMAAAPPPTLFEKVWQLLRERGEVQECDETAHVCDCVAVVCPSRIECVAGEWKVTTPYKIRGESLQHVTSCGQTVEQAAQMNQAAIDSLLRGGGGGK